MRRLYASIGTIEHEVWPVHSDEFEELAKIKVTAFPAYYDYGNPDRVWPLPIAEVKLEWRDGPPVGVLNG